MAKTRQSSSLGPISTYAGRVPFEKNNTEKDEAPDITLETRVSNLEIAVNQILVTLNDINQILGNPEQKLGNPEQPKTPTPPKPKVKLSKKDKAAQAESEKATLIASETVQKVLSNGEHLCEADIRERTGISKKRWLKVVRLLKEKDLLADDGNQDKKARLYCLNQLSTPSQQEPK